FFLPRDHSREFFRPKSLFPAAAVFLIVLVPGLILLKLSPSGGIIRSDILGRFFYLSLENLAALVLFGVLLRSQRQKNGNLYFISLFAVALLLSEYPLMDLQPILKEGIAPYHFVTLYLRPALSGLVIILVDQFCRRFPQRWARNFARGAV